MPRQRRMNKQARLELVRSYREERMSAGRGRRGEILSCLQGSTNYNRKYLIRLLQVQASRAVPVAAKHQPTPTAPPDLCPD